MPRTVTLSPARFRDACRIAALSRTEVEHGLPWRWTPARIKRCIASPDVVVLAAHEGKSMAGFAVMEFGHERAHLCLLAVNREFRRKGLGSRLLEWLETTARVAGVFEVILEVRAQNVSARAFYQRLGYAECVAIPGYYEGLEDAIRLRRCLKVQMA